MAYWFDICQDSCVSAIDQRATAREASCCGIATSPVTATDAARLAPMFKALGEPVRLQMVSMIAAQPELCVCEITPAFDLSSGTISHHLKTLREAGLVDCERRGTYVYSWVQPAALAALAVLLSPS